MTVQELIETLEDMKEQVGENAQVLFASQPSWPFQYSIRDAHALTKDERRYMAEEALRAAVSYTHLTLPTILLV